MGSVISAIIDDEREWDALQVKLDIKDMKWQLYSHEWEYARFGWKELALTGKRLKLYVKHQSEIRELKLRHKKELTELETLLALEQKYK